MADPRCTAVASCPIGGCDPSSVITASLCCAVHVVSCVRCVARLTRAVKEKNMALWQYCQMVTMPDFGFDGVSSSLAEFISIFFFLTSFFTLFFLLCTLTQTPQTTQTSHEQCRVRASTSWLQRYTHLPPASGAGSNTTRVR